VENLTGPGALLGFIEKNRVLISVQEKGTVREIFSDEKVFHFPPIYQPRKLAK
jgi:hypothetical protein